ncbi:hypothetical protein Bca101_001460 [Brassica carinata]
MSLVTIIPSVYDVYGGYGGLRLPTIKNLRKKDMQAMISEESEVKKGPWTPEEDEKLVSYIQAHGPGKWRTLPKNAGKWSAIAIHLPGRTDNEIKNYWNTHIKKKLLRMGIDPVTHCPRINLLQLSSFLTSSLFKSMSQPVNIPFGLANTSINPELLNQLNTSLSNVQTESYQPHQANQQLQNDHQTSFTGLLNSTPPVQWQNNGECLENYLSYTVSGGQSINQVPLTGNYSSAINDGENYKVGWNFSSSMLPSSSTPLNSSSTSFINVGSEDDKESYGSDMLILKSFEVTLWCTHNRK